MLNTTLNNIYSYSLEGATKLEKMAVSLQLYLSNQSDLLTWFLLKFADNKWVVWFLVILFTNTFVF